MGYSQLFAQGWTWGNLLAEGIAAFLFVFLLTIGYRLIENTNASSIGKRALLGVAIFVIVLISALSSLGISELYRRSSGAPILTPIFGLFYGFIIGSFNTVGVIIAAQIIGSFVGFLLAKVLRPRLQDKLAEKSKVSVRSVLLRNLAVVFLLASIAVISLINPTSYGGTPVLKIVIMALAIGGFVVVFGGADFYSYISFYKAFSISYAFNSGSETDLDGNPKNAFSFIRVWKYGSVSFVRAERPGRNLAGNIKQKALSSENAQALLSQFAALGLLIGVYSLVQSFPYSLQISNVI